MTDMPEWRAWADRDHADSLKNPKLPMKWWCENCGFACRGKEPAENHVANHKHTMYRARRRTRSIHP